MTPVDPRSMDGATGDAEAAQAGPDDDLDPIDPEIEPNE
jgi:hypothetical protein